MKTTYRKCARCKKKYETTDDNFAKVRKGKWDCWCRKCRREYIRKYARDHYKHKRGPNNVNPTRQQIEQCCWEITNEHLAIFERSWYRRRQIELENIEAYEAKLHKEISLYD